jgi:GT2 family glycosyltransferase
MTRTPAAPPRLSVVVATYNRAASLDRLLIAIAAQPGLVTASEVVVVDDGSTDDTAAVVARHGHRRVVTGHVGPAAARNAGWRAAQGELVVFTDDDCVPATDWLAGLLAAFADDGVEGVGGGIVPLLHGYFEDFSHAERLADHGVAPDGSVRYLVTANAAYRRSALERVGGFDETFPRPAGEDVDLSARVVETGGRLALAPDAIVAHDYRRGMRPLVRTYWRHGAARARLARAHTSLATGSAARRAVGPAALRDRYRRYRSLASPGRAASYVALRTACLGVFVAGLTAAKTGMTS